LTQAIKKNYDKDPLTRTVLANPENHKKTLPSYRRSDMDQELSQNGCDMRTQRKLLNHANIDQGSQNHGPLWKPTHEGVHPMMVLVAPTGKVSGEILQDVQGVEVLAAEVNLFYANKILSRTAGLNLLKKNLFAPTIVKS